MAAEVATLIAELRRSPWVSAAPLMRAVGVGSQASFSRLLARAGDAVLRVGTTRDRRYAAARSVGGLAQPLPLYRVGEDGALARVAVVAASAPEGVCVSGAPSLPRWMRGAQGNGIASGLPVFHVGQRPAGFLGHSFARRHPALGLPDRPEDWTDDDTLVALACAGEDLTGDLVTGETSATRLYESRARGLEPIPRGERSHRYPALATEAIGGAMPGACLGGTQPKFGAFVGDAGSAVHALVKFSPAEISPSARRWCDLLACEHLALEAMRAHGWAAAKSGLVEGGSRVFLEVERFDRVGERGRRPAVSLAAMNAEYLRMPPGAGHWVGAIERLADEGFVLPATVDRARALDAFGRFIANTDMHFGNLSFTPRDDGTLDLAPVYDMLPMGYAPVAGDVPARVFAAPLPEPGREVAWSEAGALAATYWRAVARDDRVSDPFRRIAADNAAVVEEILSRF